MQQFRREDVRHLFDLIPGARMALHSNAQRAQPLDPAPHSEARHACFPCDFRAADDDHAVVGKQRQQRVNAPIGRTRECAVRHFTLNIAA